MNDCKGVCIRYRAVRPPSFPGIRDGTSGRYINGQRRCQHCQIFLKREGYCEKRRCRCCGNLTRGAPRNSRKNFLTLALIKRVD